MNKKPLEGFWRDKTIKKRLPATHKTWHWTTPDMSSYKSATNLSWNLTWSIKPMLQMMNHMTSAKASQLFQRLWRQLTSDAGRGAATPTVLPLPFSSACPFEIGFSSICWLLLLLLLFFTILKGISHDYFALEFLFRIGLKLNMIFYLFILFEIWSHWMLFRHFFVGGAICLVL